MTDEYIKKEDVLREKRTGTFPNGICMEAKACVTVEYIKSIQPADVVPVVHGKWTRILLRNEKGGCIGAEMICSECGSPNGHDEKTRFCPNCGAKMDKE